MFVYCTAQYNFNSTRENHLVDIIVFFLFPTTLNKNKFHYACLNKEKQIEIDLSFVTVNVWICGHCMIEE